MFDLLPIEIIAMILEYLPINELIKATHINRVFKYVIRNITWKHEIVKECTTDEEIMQISEFYSFTSYNFSYSKNITSKAIETLHGCRIINLYYCGITDACLISLAKLTHWLS